MTFDTGRTSGVMMTGNQLRRSILTGRSRYFCRGFKPDKPWVHRTSVPYMGNLFVGWHAHCPCGWQTQPSLTYVYPLDTIMKHARGCEHAKRAYLREHGHKIRLIPRDPEWVTEHVDALSLE